MGLQMVTTPNRLALRRFHKMKYVMIGLLTLSLAGCGQWERTKANYTGYSEVCVDGVTYLQFPSGSSVKYDTSGKIVGC
jgi:uncharacterized lipoprotein YehR (DUF1307 family)